MADKTYIVRQKTAFQEPQSVYLVAGAITDLNGGQVLLSGTAARAMTLAAPSVNDNGVKLTIIATTAFAHTVTQTTPGFNNGSTASDVATFGGAVGDNIVLIAYNGIWYVQSTRNVTLA